MIQLTFQASLDPFHAMFRLIRFRHFLQNSGELSVDHARIIDFYFMFPFRIGNIRLQQGHRKYRKLADDYKYAKPYGEQPDDSTLFARMAPMQTAAMETIAANGFLDPARLRASWLKPTSRPLPSALLARVQELNDKDMALLIFLNIMATEYSVSGPNGLKHRTGLMEHRYDVF